MIACVNRAGSVAEYECYPSAVNGGSSGKFVLGRRTEVVGADDDVAKGVAVFLTCGQFDIQESRGFCGRRAFLGAVSFARDSGKRE